MDKLAKNIEKRSSARAGITKLIKKIQSLNFDVETVDNLTELFELLETKSNILKEYDLEIEELITDPAKFKTEIAASEEYYEKILTTKIKLKNKIKDMNKKDDQRGSQNTSSISEHNFSALKLPKLEIPRFSGDSNFTEFLNCFDSAIGSNDSLSKIEKFQYLKSLLSPPAYNVVAGFELNEKNYDSCLELLKQRYGRSDYIINSYMSKLLNLEPVRNSSYVKGLRKLYDEIEVNIRNLRALNVTEGSYGHLLNPILLKLLPQDLVLDFHRKRNKEANCEVSEIMTFLRNEVESREICETVISSSKNSETKRTSFQNYQTGQTYQRNYSKPKNVSSAATLLTQVKNVCIFCELNSHDSLNCRKLDVEQKINKLKSEARCWSCFKPKHLSRNCRSGIVCKVCFSRYHHESVCRKNYKPSNAVERNKENSRNLRSLNSNEIENERTSSTASEVISSVSQCNNVNTNCSKNVYLQTCSVVAKSENKSCLTRLMFDCGSSRSFISEKLANDLKLKTIRNEILSIYSFGMKCPTEKVYRVVEVTLGSTNSPFQKTFELFVSQTISGAVVKCPDGKIKDFMQKRNLRLADSSNSNNKIDILLGADVCWELIYGEKVSIDNKLSAMNSSFGWLIIGAHNNGSNCSENMIIVNNAISNDLRIFWEIEEFPNETKNLSEKENQLIKNFENSLKFNGERYVCKLMWKDDMGPPLELDSNYEVASRRFNSLKNKLDKNPEISDQYKEIVSDQLKCNIVGKCIDEDLNSGYYMPHRAVIRDDKETTRVRMVYDCSSKANENKSSLNDSLESGVNLYPNLLDIILKFRENQVAFCGDLEKAFLMIEIAEEDRKYLKFLWFPDEPDDSVQTLQLNRLPFGLTTSPFALACVLKFHIRKFKDDYPDCYEMLNSLYVDDLYDGAKNAQVAYKLTSLAIEILRAAGFKLRKLKTNSEELNKLWRENGYEENMDFGQGEGFLGLKWDPIEDRIKLDLKDVRDSLEFGITKRHVLSVISKIFDPCGLVSPFVIRVKILIQELWERGIKWDESLPDDLQEKWRTWCSELVELDNFSIQRKLFSMEDVSDVSLHIFVDASPKAYGAVAYLRYLTREGQIKISFVISKSKVAPLKALTLARLELMAALVGARLGKYIQSLFPAFTQNTFFWSDSKIVLHWVKGSSKVWKPFVANRVAQVQSLSLPECWNFCSGSENPADFTTRGESAKKILTSSLWWTGPPWLSQPVHLWPAPCSTNRPDDSSNEEVISKELRTVAVNTVALTEPLIDLNKYSSFLKCLRILAWIKRFVARARKLKSESGPLSARELEEAEQYFIRKIQSEHFSNEIEVLKSKKSISPNSNIFSLAPFLDENNIIRIKGRLNESEFTFGEKHPILLPRDSRFTELIVSNLHNKMLHAGVAATLTKIRQNFWIIKGRQLVKRVIHNCLVCRKYSLKSTNQITAQLPKDRLLENPPFEICGLDFAGPIYYKCDKEIKKAYFVIFTCAITRAIHLELVSSMTTKHFLLAFRRFISRRGSCSIVYSDNAKSFKAANKDLVYFSKILKDSEFKDFVSSHGIHWKFIVERAPWWGGFYERLVKSVKEPLRKILGKALLTFEALATILSEIEYIVNSRPLTYVFDSFSEPDPITPLHFLQYGRKIHKFPIHFAELANKVSNKESLIKRKKYQITLLKNLWVKFKEQYLLQLKNAHHFKSPLVHKDVKINDVVLVEGTSKSKLLWDLGIIQETFQGRDGHVRACVVKTKKGLFRKPVQLIYPFEL